MIKKGHRLQLPTLTTIHGVQLNTNQLEANRLYLSFLHNIDCLLCNVHIFNMAFESNKYSQKGSLVIFILNSEPKDTADFIKEHPNFAFHIVIDNSKKIFSQFGLPFVKKSLLGIKKAHYSMCDVLVNKGVIEAMKYYCSDKEHLEYSTITEFLED